MESDNSGVVLKPSIRKIILICAVLFGISALCVALVVSGLHPTQEEHVNQPLSEILSEIQFDGAAEDWINLLPDEKKQAVEHAYESGKSSGYKGSRQEWFSSEITARYNRNGGIVVVLPDGNEFTVSENEIIEYGLTGVEDWYSFLSSKEEQAGDTATESMRSSSSSTSSNGLSSARLIVDDIQVHSGDSDVVVPVRIEGNPGILGTTLSVSYDESVLTLKNATNGKAFEESLSFTQPASYGSGCLFTWDGIELSPEEIKDGTILLLQFDVSENAASGAYAVAVRNSSSSFDANLNEVNLLMQDGYVVVE